MAETSDAERLMVTAKALCLVSSVTYSGAALDDLRRLLASASARLDSAEALVLDLRAHIVMSDSDLDMHSKAVALSDRVQAHFARRNIDAEG